MSEIEKMKRYIERTNIEEKKTDPYKMNICEAFELAHQALSRGDLPIDVITPAFDYGRAKGYRAAKAEARRGYGDRPHRPALWPADGDRAGGKREEWTRSMAVPMRLR